MTTATYRIIRKSTFGEAGRIFYSLTAVATVGNTPSAYEFPVDVSTYDLFNVEDIFKLHFQREHR